MRCFGILRVCYEGKNSRQPLRATLTVGCAAITRVDPTSQVERLASNFLLASAESLLASSHLRRISLRSFGLNRIE